jgi:hypothetical protein
MTLIDRAPSPAAVPAGEEHQQHAARDEQQTDGQADPRQHGNRQSPETGRDGEQVTLHARPQPDGNVGGVRRQAREPGDGGEPVAVGLERAHVAVHRSDGLAAVAPTVVEHHHGAARTLRCRVGEDRGHAGAPPVLGVAVGEDDEIALAGHCSPRPDVGDARGVRLRRVGGAEQAGVHASS